jgi:hypothetical protein
VLERSVAAADRTGHSFVSALRGRDEQSFATQTCHPEVQLAIPAADIVVEQLAGSQATACGAFTSTPSSATQSWDAELLANVYSVLPYSKDHQVFPNQQRSAVIFSSGLDYLLFGHWRHLQRAQQ